MGLSSIFGNNKPNLHHVWIGSKIKQKELDYARLWAQANPDSKQRVWVDQYALMVNDVKQQIIHFAEHEALVRMGITDLAALMSQMTDNGNLTDLGHDYFELVSKLASEKRYQLDERLSKTDIKGHDGVRYEFAVAIYETLHGKRAAQTYQTELMQRYGADFAAVQTAIENHEVYDISALMGRKKNKKLYAAYLKELNLRQNTAAASDIVRVVALKEQGGIYADLDLLPTSKAIDKIREILERKNFLFSKDQRRTGGAITDAIITALKCVDGYRPGTLYELEPREYLKGQEGPDGKYTAEQLAQLNELNKTRKGILESVVAEFVKSRGNDPRSLFDSVNWSAELGSDGLAMGVETGKLVINAFILAKRDNTLVKKVAKKIAAHYDFMGSIEGLIRESALGEKGTSFKELYTQIDALLPPELVGEAQRASFIQAMLSYMQDGIVPGSMAAVSISGAGAFLGLLMDRYNGDDQAVEKAIATHAYSLDGADERASSWSNGDGVARIQEIGHKNFVPQELHHIWVGSALRQKESDYAKVWADANPDYQAHLWFDPSGLAVNAVKQEILRYAERLASRSFGLDTAEQFEAFLKTKRSDISAFKDAILKFASQARYELLGLLEGVPASNRDDVRIAFASELRHRTDGAESAAALKIKLIETLARDRTVMQSTPHARDLYEVLDLPENRILKQAYELEMNLRQNMAAASDIARVAILKREGGVYADIDLLPQFGLSFDAIKERLRVNGYLLPGDMPMIEEQLRTMITDAVLEQLHVIAGYDTSAVNKPVTGELWTEDLDKRQQNNDKYREILRATVKEIIDEANHNGGIFKRLGAQSPQTGGFLTADGLRQVGNYLMVSTAEGEVIGLLHAEIAKRYGFLMDADVFKKINDISIGITDESWSIVSQLTERARQLGLIGDTEKGRFDTPKFIGALAEYMADGLSPHAQTTVHLSGPMALRDVLAEVLGLSSKLPSSKDLEPFLTDQVNRHTSDFADSSWMVEGEDRLMEQIRARLFPAVPDEPPVLTGTDHPDDVTRWTVPELSREAKDTSRDGSFNYDHQVIIQLDPDEISSAAAHALFKKRPDQSVFIQWREDGAHLYALASDGSVVQPGAPFEGWANDNALRLTFVGHGVGSEGAFEFGGRTPAQFLDLLGGLLKKVEVNRSGTVLINLVACQLENTSLREQDTFAGQVASRLVDVLSEVGLSPEHVILRARAGDVSVGSSGHKTGESIQYSYDPDEARFARSAIAPHTDVPSHESGSTPRPDVVAPITQPLEPTDPPAKVLGRNQPQLRSDRETLLLQLAEVISLRNERNRKIATLDIPDQALKLIPELVREAANGGYEIGFAPSGVSGIDAGDPRTQWVHTEDDVFMRWKKRAEALGQGLSAGVRRVGNGLNEVGKYLLTPDSEASAVHSITSAFLLQALIGPQGAILTGNRQSALEALSGRSFKDLSPEEIAALDSHLTYLRAQQGVNYAALTSGLVSDSVELAKLFSTLRDENRGTIGSLTKALSKAGVALRFMGLLFDVGNVVFASIDLANAQTDRERVEAGVNLGFSLTALGLETGSIVAGVIAAGASAGAAGVGVGVGATGVGAGSATAGMAGAGAAATTATVLGVLGVIATGLGIGVTALVHTIHEARARIDVGLKMLEDYLAAAQKPVEKVSPNVYKFHDSLAATGFDMNSGELSFADVRIATLKGPIGFVVPSISDKYINMLAPFTHENGATTVLDTADFGEGSVFVLPNKTAVDFEYQLVTYGYADLDEEYPLLSKLEKSTSDHEFYLWGRGGLTVNTYVPGMIVPTYRDTNFRLVLDAKRHLIVVPTVQTPEFDGSHIPRAFAKLGYTLVGGGGSYTVTVPALQADVTIQSAFAPTEHWTFNVSNAVYGLTKDSSAAPRPLPKGVFDSIAVTHDGITVGGKTAVHFEGDVKRNQLSVLVGLDSEGKNNLLWSLDGKGVSDDTTKGDGAVGRWEITPNERDSILLSVGNRDELSRDSLIELAGLVRAAGIHRRFIALGTADGYVGSLDMDTGGYTLSAHDVSSGSSYLYINNVLVREDKLPGSFSVNQYEREGAPGVVATYGFDDAQWLSVAYVDGDVVDERLVVSDTLFSAYAFGGGPGNRKPMHAVGGALEVKFDGSVASLAQWAKSHAAGDVQLSDHTGNEATITFTTDHTAYLSRHYVRQESFDLSVDTVRRRAVLTLRPGQSYSLDELNKFSTALAYADELEVYVLGAGFTGQRIALDINLDASVLFNKRITLLTSVAVDLRVTSARMTWDVDGTDLAFFAPDSMLRWLSTDERTLASHTLNLGDSAGELESTLARHEDKREHHIWEAREAYHDKEPYSHTSSMIPPPKKDKNAARRKMAPEPVDLQDKDQATCLLEGDVLAAVTGDNAKSVMALIEQPGRPWKVRLLNRQTASELWVHTVSPMGAPRFGPKKTSVVIDSYRTVNANDWVEFSGSTGEFIVHRSSSYRLDLTARDDFRHLASEVKSIAIDLDEACVAPGVIALDMFGIRIDRSIRISSINPVKVELYNTGERDVRYALTGDDLVITSRMNHVRLVGAAAAHAPAYRIGIAGAEDVSVADVVMKLKADRERPTLSVREVSESSVIAIDQSAASERDEQCTETTVAWRENAQRLSETLNLYTDNPAGEVSSRVGPDIKTPVSLSVLG